VSGYWFIASALAQTTLMAQPVTTATGRYFSPSLAKPNPSCPAVQRREPLPILSDFANTWYSRHLFRSRGTVAVRSLAETEGSIGDTGPVHLAPDL